MQQQSDSVFQGAPVNVNPLEYPSVKCPDCGCQTFIPAMIFKRIPGIALGAGAEEQEMAIKVFVCSKCGGLSPRDREMLGEESGEKKQNQGEYTTTTQLII